MQNIFAQSQWDALLAYLHQGRPALWMTLAAANGLLLALWLYRRATRVGPPRPASVFMMRALFVLINLAVIFREDTMRLLRPFLRYVT
jgi:hypothetical protein